MKTIIRSRVFLIITCGIFFTSLGISATNMYNASDITYIKDGNSINVESALNELYEKGSEPKITFVNNGATYNAIGKEQTIDLTSYSNYKDLVLNKNLFLVLHDGSSIVSHYDYDRTSVSSSLGYSYNASTGILTYYVKLNGSLLNMNYYNSVNFKVLIID